MRVYWNAHITSKRESMLAWSLCIRHCFAIWISLFAIIGDCEVLQARLLNVLGLKDCLVRSRLVENEAVALDHLFTIDKSAARYCWYTLKRKTRPICT